MADGISVTKPAAARLRKANEYFINVKQFKTPEKLFDEFWREGELALFFGAAGTGKSILAVQIAEAIARGRGIDGFARPARRHKVLYVDLKLSDRQFGMRYTSEEKRHKFSENLYRDRPPINKPLCEWLRSAIRENGCRVIVIDDLSAIRQTYDGTRETLKLMRELKQLKDELDVSVLVLAGSREPGGASLASEADLMRSRVLCDAADSVFALGLHPSNAQYRYLVQTRSQSAAIKWHSGNVPVCSIERSDDGFLGLKFDERFVAEVDEETRQLICNVKWRHDAGASYREIADELGISKSTAARLCKKWTPALEKDLVVEPESEPPAVAGGLTNDSTQSCEPADGYLPQINADNADQNQNKIISLSASSASSAVNNSQHHVDWAAMPFLAALRRIHVTDLKRGIDGYGREIFIFKEQEFDGKPIDWYEYDSKGKLIRKQRIGWGISIKRPETPWISSAYALRD